MFRLAAACPVVALLASVCATACAAPAVGIELGDDTRQTGTLVAIDPEVIQIAGTDGATRSIAVGTVRRVEGEAVPPAPVGGPVRLTLTDGTTLLGDGFAVAGATATLDLAGGRAKLPLARVRQVDFSGGESVGQGAAPRRGWLDAVPEGVTSDLVVVAKADGFEFVECAITAVSADSVTVVLDEETIPVRRSKVIGLRWLRGESPAARTVVQVRGGVLRAETVAWTPAGLVLDAESDERRITLPALTLESVDYAAGRSTFLATLAPEELEVDPFFGSLGKVAGLSTYFAPRAVATARRDEKFDLVMRPRTVVTYRIPAEARRFRTRLVPKAGAGPAAVTIKLDGRPLLEQVVSGAGVVPVDVDVSGGRRLAVAVDFGLGGGMAGVVRLVEPVIEQ